MSDKKFMLEAFHNQVIVKQLDNEEKMYGRILIADAGKEKPLMGIVLDSGPGHYTAMGNLIPNKAKVGDTVFFTSFGGIRITYEGEEYIVCKDIDLLVRLKEETATVNTAAIEEILKETAESLTPIDKVSYGVVDAKSFQEARSKYPEGEVDVTSILEKLGDSVK